MKYRTLVGLAVLSFILIIGQYSCNAPNVASDDYPRMIGDIAFDENMDSEKFVLCQSERLAVQYYAFTKMIGGKPFLHEKHEVERIFEEKYNSEKVKKESGLVRIRFMVNCRGETGRFRVLGMDEFYEEKIFDDSITDQLLSITRSDLKWRPYVNDKVKRDYYMYLIFKLNEGEIIEIMP